MNDVEMLKIGLHQMGYILDDDFKKKAITSRFKDIYGVSAKVCTLIFNDVQTKDLGDAEIDKPRAWHTLIAFFWLKNYSFATEPRMAVFFKKDEDTVRKYLWKYLKAIQALKKYKVRRIGRETYR